MENESPDADLAVPVSVNTPPSHLHFPAYTSCTVPSKCFSHAGGKYDGGKTAGGHFREENGGSHIIRLLPGPRPGVGSASCLVWLHHWLDGEQVTWGELFLIPSIKAAHC